MDKNTLLRIKEYIDFKCINNSTFEKEIGMSNGSFSSQLKNNKTIGVDKLENILKKYLDINPEWLLTGEGSMLKEYASKEINDSTVQEPPPKYTAKKVANDRSDGIPLIPIEAMAGWGTGDVQIMEFESERFVVPTFRGADFLIQVKGSSMYPKYNSGDIVACKKLVRDDVFFQWNKVYVIDTEQGAIIKRVDPGKDDDHILIVSDNEKYKPFNLPKHKIHAISIVMGVIRLE